MGLLGAGRAKKKALGERWSMRRNALGYPHNFNGIETDDAIGGLYMK